MPQVSAIIPTYNEAGRISGVLAVLRSVPELQEIVVVDDGSTDSTCKEVRAEAEADQRIRVIEMVRNRGKGQAVLAGARTIHDKVVLLLDADLIDLRPSHIRALIRPVTTGRAAMTIGLFRGGRFTTDLGHIGTPWLSGQRCLRMDLLRHLTDATASGYGLEIALTVIAQRYDYRVERVILRGVWHPSAEFHRGLGKALAWRARMYSQIWDAWLANGGPSAAVLQVKRAVGEIWQDPLRAWRKARKRVERLRQER